MKHPYYTVESLTPFSSVGYLVKRCGSMMTAIAEEAFQGQPVTFTQWVVLMSLRLHDAHLSPTGLSQETGYDMGALTRVVDGLAQNGYVRRERSETDRRAVDIMLTSAGRRQAEACIPLIVDLLNDLIEPFSKTEVDMLIPLLQRLFQRLNQRIDTPREKVAARQGKTPPRKNRRTV